MVPGTGIETGTRSTTSPRSVAQGRLFGTRDFKLRCFAGVSAAGIPKRSEGSRSSLGARDRNRTGTSLSGPGILSPTDTHMQIRFQNHMLLILRTRARDLF